MSDGTFYRVDYEAEAMSHVVEHQEEVNHLIEHSVLIPVEPDLYVMRWGGLFESFYRCDKDEADGAVFALDKEDNDE